jgi:DNA-binding NarL/FixJ family response regulator
MARYLRRLWEASKTLNHKVDAIKWEVQRTMCAFHTAGWSYGSIANAIGVNPNTVSLHVKECCKMFDEPLNHLIPNVGVV